MLVGVNEKLEKLVHDYSEGDTKVDFGDVMVCVTNSIACGDSWYVSAEMMEDGMNETDFEESRCFGGLPMFKTALENRNDEKFLVAYTSEEAVSASGRGQTTITVKYHAKALLEDLMQSEECSGIVINPWTDDFIISRKNAEKALELAEEISAEEIRAMQTVRLEPRAIIDTGSIIKEWQEGWHDEDGKEENWRLVSYPVMADGRVLLLFEMVDKIYDSEQEAAGSLGRYRVLEYRIGENGPELLNRYKFRVQDGKIGTVTLYDGVLRAAVAPDRDEANWSMLQMFPNDDDAQYHLYSNVQTTVSDSRGNMIVAYEKNLMDEGRWPLMVIDTEGKILMRYHDEHALVCMDVNLDAEENVWFSMFPSATLDMLNAEENDVEAHNVAMQGFDDFALSTDRSKLFVNYGWNGGGSVQYVMTADGNGNYVDPVRFDFRPEDAAGNVLEAKDCRVFGRMSSNKSVVILNADGRLHIYNVDDCCGENG